MRRIQFYVTEAEWEELAAYCRYKHRWHSVGEMARDGLWQLVARNAIGVKRAGKSPKVSTDANGPKVATQYCVTAPGAS